MLSTKSQEKLNQFDAFMNEIENDDEAVYFMRNMFVNELTLVDKLSGADKPFHGCVECGGANNRHEAHCSKCQ